MKVVIALNNLTYLAGERTPGTVQFVELDDQASCMAKGNNWV